MPVSACAIRSAGRLMLAVGCGEVAALKNVAVVPRRPYVPAGSLRAAATYPVAPDDVADTELRQALAAVGLAQFLPRVDDELPWERTLSMGEKQRLAIARLLLHRPSVIVLDEATSALDEVSQVRVMNAIREWLPAATVLSVGHRAELADFHERRLTLWRQPGGARIVADELSVKRTAEVPEDDRPTVRLRPAG